MECFLRLVQGKKLRDRKKVLDFFSNYARIIPKLFDRLTLYFVDKYFFRVGHIYRLEGWDGNPPPAYVPTNPSMRNYRRVIETWWDEYKEYFYVSRPESKTLDFGDTSVQVQFRKGVFCLIFFLNLRVPRQRILVLRLSKNGITSFYKP